MNTEGNQVFQHLQILFPVVIFKLIQDGQKLSSLHVLRARLLLHWRAPNAEVYLPEKRKIGLYWRMGTWV